MAVRDYLRAMREWWIIIVAAVLLGLLVGGVAAATIPTRYSTSTTLYFAMQGSEGADFSAYEGNLLAQQRVKSSEALVTKERVGQEIVDQLGVDMSAADVVREISTEADLDSVLLTISVSDTSAERAAQIANAAADALNRLAVELEPAPGSVPVSIVTKVVQPAEVPGSPGLWASLQWLVGGLVTGLVIGIGIAILRASWDTSIRSIAALRDAAGSPVLALTFEDRAASSRPLGSGGRAEDALAESGRRLRAGLEFGQTGSAGSTVLVTSAGLTADRTAVVAHLAVAYVKAGHTVAVVEADTRSSRTASLFQLASTPGLPEVLSGTSPLRDAVQRPMPGFDVLVSGSHVPNIGELVSSPAMSELVTELRIDHDIVLIDAPPVLPAADTMALAPLADAVLLVCRYGSLHDEVQTAVDALQTVAATVAGTVLTAVPVKARGFSDHRAVPVGRPDLQPADSVRRPEAVGSTAPADPVVPNDRVQDPVPLVTTRPEQVPAPVAGAEARSEPVVASGPAARPAPMVDEPVAVGPDQVRVPRPRPSPRRRTVSENSRPSVAAGVRKSAS